MCRPKLNYTTANSRLKLCPCHPFIRKKIIIFFIIKAFDRISHSALFSKLIVIFIGIPLSFFNVFLPGS
jgi:hypothetical protein